MLLPFLLFSQSGFVVSGKEHVDCVVKGTTHVKISLFANVTTRLVGGEGRGGEWSGGEWRACDPDGLGEAREVSLASSKRIFSSLAPKALALILAKSVLTRLLAEEHVF